MKYFSEKLNKVFDTAKECKEAEVAFDKEEAEKVEKREARAARAKEVEDAYKKYQELLQKFIKDYGSFHMTINDGTSIFDLFDNFIW